MSAEGIIQRLNNIYNLAEDREDIRSMIKVSELLYKIENTDKARLLADNLPLGKMETIIEYLEQNL